jgi:uncharacterized protein YdhG (YjbR/CyaY superfamily)
LKGAIVDVDGYLAGLDEAPRRALEELRKHIRIAAPNAQEGLSYGNPTYKLKQPLFAFAATTTHCAFYMMSEAPLRAHDKELARFDVAKTAVRFSASSPLPGVLVRKIVKARLREFKANV